MDSVIRPWRPSLVRFLTVRMYNFKAACVMVYLSTHEFCRLSFRSSSLRLNIYLPRVFLPPMRPLDDSSVCLSVSQERKWSKLSYNQLLKIVRISEISIECRKKSGVTLVFTWFTPRLVQKTRAILSTNQRQEYHQSPLGCPHFPALQAVCLFRL